MMEQTEKMMYPVPAPRRLHLEEPKTNYENIRIETTDENLNITVGILPAAAAAAAVVAVTARQSASILANNSVSQAEPVYATPRPMPRGRKPTKDTCDPVMIAYENTLVRDGRVEVIDAEDPLPLVVVRKAPELPPKSSSSAVMAERERERDREHNFRHSITSEVSTTSSCAISNRSVDLDSFQSDSSVTLNSSNADLSEGPEGSKNKLRSARYVELSSYKPVYAQTGASAAAIAADAGSEASKGSIDANDASNEKDNKLLKSLGNTSKMLTKEAITALDKNLKSSTELLTDLSQEATSRLKTASKRFGMSATPTSTVPTATFYADRSTTLPPNNPLFNSLKFSSPLKAGRHDLVATVDAEVGDNSYEVPQSVKPVNRNDPPSYELAVGSGNHIGGRPTNINTSPADVANLSKSIAVEAAKLVRTRRVSAEKSNTDSSDSGWRDSVELPSLPMPTYAPPALPKELAESSQEHVYGKLNSTSAAVKRRNIVKNYEQIELRKPCNREDGALTPSSLRPNVDSAELHELNLAAAAAEHKESMFIKEQIRQAELSTPKPERSQSWEFHADEVASVSACSTPEPLYANNEATYGRLFEIATSGREMLTPQSDLTCITEEHDAEIETDSSAEGAVGGEGVLFSKDVIDQFDPLSRKSSTVFKSNKSNELLLLEHLLEEDTYANFIVKEEDDMSEVTSEEDNGSVTGAVADKKAQRGSVESVPDLIKQMDMFHQNTQLLSEKAMEARVQPYLSRVEENPSLKDSEIDLSRSSHNRTKWFADGMKEIPPPPTSTEPTSAELFEKLNIEGESPPTFLEAISSDNMSQTNDTKPASSGNHLAARLNPRNFISNVKNRVDAMKRKASFKASQKKADVKVALQMIPRPSLSPNLVRNEGILVRYAAGVVEELLKELHNRYCFLRDRQFLTFADYEMKTPKEAIALEHITTLQVVTNNRITDNATQFYCFEITTCVPKNSNSNSVSTNNLQVMSSNPNLVMTSGSSGNCKHQRNTYLYGVIKESERGIWLQKMLESLTNLVPLKYTYRFYRAGWCYLKTSITSEWSGAWLVLRRDQRRLLFVTESAGNVEKLDLRKARYISLSEPTSSDPSTANLHIEDGPRLMIDCPPYTVYAIMSSPRETKIWRHIISEVAHNNGFSLSDQQLTKFNVPVIVDKCINFVYIHGSMTEGIYRKSGSENSISKLMTAFRTDAFSVVITRNLYNEHDVANVLKRFMRNLPEPLIGKLTESFICVTELSNSAEKIPIYKELLARLSIIEYETLKRIVAHLVFISSQKAKNKMSVKNLTTIWGPTLLADTPQAEELVYSQKKAEVLTDLIKLYRHLFPMCTDELRKEQAMLTYLQKYYASSETLTDTVKKSGDLKVWIQLSAQQNTPTEEKVQVGVSISPTKTAYEICRELAPKMQLSAHQLVLYEIILDDSLERPLHHDTKVFDIILGWTCWNKEDRKNNYLMVKPVDFLREVHRAIKKLATVTPSKELKFVDSRTKSFKSLQCELRDNKIVVSRKYKNDKTTIMREIFLQSTTAYLGCEKKREFPWSWAITFIEPTQMQLMRSRDAPYIGHVLAGSEWSDRTIWYSSIWYSLHGDNILPPVECILK